MLFAFLSLHLQEMGAWMKNQEEAHLQTRGLPRWRHGKEPTGPCRRRKRRRFNPWVGKIPWRNTWQPTPAIIPWIEEPNGLQSMGSQRAGHNQSDLERSTCICYGPAVIFFCSYFRGLLAPRGQFCSWQVSCFGYVKGCSVFVIITFQKVFYWTQVVYKMLIDASRKTLIIEEFQRQWTRKKLNV